MEDNVLLSVSHSVSRFGAKFFKEADSSCSHSSITCSPLSAKIVMAMLALGCKEKSHRELLKALDCPDDDDLRSTLAHLTSTLKSIKGPTTCNVANKIYLKKGAELKPIVKKDAEEVFESIIEHLDFRRKDAAISAIHSWVAQQTDGNGFLALPVNSAVHLVLVNAIHFQGLWEKPFDTRLDVSNFPFSLSTNNTTAVTAMKMTETWFQHGVSPELNARILQMKFEGGEASMIIVLPDEVEGLESVLEKLASGHNIMADIESLRKTEVDVTLPKFDGQLSSPLPLVSVLSKLGIKSIFDERISELNMLTADEELLGSTAAQDTSIHVDEREIAETVDCSISKTEGISSKHRAPCFVADRPFLYLIIVRNVPIFIGSYRGDDARGHLGALNYSCNYLNHVFSLTVCTFYSRYNNTQEQEKITDILKRYYARQVTMSAVEENWRNEFFERRYH